MYVQIDYGGHLLGKRCSLDYSYFLFVFCLSLIESRYEKTGFLRCTVLFVWDLVVNPEDRFSHNEAHVYYVCL